MSTVQLKNKNESDFGYRIEELVGRGGTGIVFKATQLSLKRIVALKTIKRKYSKSKSIHKQFLLEANLVAKLNHPNIVSAFDFGYNNRSLFLAMEFLNGLDAARYLRARKVIEEFEMWWIIRQTSIALAYASQHGVIHRDIKPSNIILSAAPFGWALPPGVPFVKVTDFGLARIKNRPNHKKRFSTQSMVSGTPTYMSPESISIDDYTESSDIYSLGITAWCLLTGKAPVKGDSLNEILREKRMNENRWLDYLPVGFSNSGRRLIRKMFAFDKKKRIQNHIQLISEIDQVLSRLESSPNKLLNLYFPESAPERFSFDFLRSDTTRIDHPMEKTESNDREQTLSCPV